MKIRYKLYEVKHIKGMMIFEYVAETLAYNTIEAEDEFDVRGNMNSGGDYIIVISK